MATALGSVKNSPIPKANVNQLMQNIKQGDLVFCWGDAEISHGIELFTGGKGVRGPSHVLKVWQPFPNSPWLTLEAEADHGVRIGPFSDYLKYDGDIVLCRRSLSLEQVNEELKYGFTLLDFKYDSVEFISVLGRDFINRFPVFQPAKELYCSGLQQAIAMKSVPFDVPSRPWATPQQLFTEESVQTVLALLGE